MDDLEKALDAFSKAMSMPGGPSLAMQRHDPTWEAWKKLCNIFAERSKQNSRHNNKEWAEAVTLAYRCSKCGTELMTSNAEPIEWHIQKAIVFSVAPMMTVIQKVLAAYGNQRDKINDSDLDNEQPISLTVYLTLGELRNARRAAIFAGHRPADFSTRPLSK